MSNPNANLTSFVLGAIAGGVTALLFAPMSGARLREQIGERRDELTARTNETARLAAEKARETVDGARDAARQQATAVSEAIDEGKAAYKRELEKAKAS